MNIMNVRSRKRDWYSLVLQYILKICDRKNVFVERSQWLVNNVGTKLKCAFSQICNRLMPQI